MATIFIERQLRWYPTDLLPSGDVQASDNHDNEWSTPLSSHEIAVDRLKRRQMRRSVSDEHLCALQQPSPGHHSNAVHHVTPARMKLPAVMAPPRSTRRQTSKESPTSNTSRCPLDNPQTLRIGYRTKLLSTSCPDLTAQISREGFDNVTPVCLPSLVGLPGHHQHGNKTTTAIVKDKSGQLLSRVTQRVPCKGVTSSPTVTNDRRLRRATCYHTIMTGSPRDTRGCRGVNQSSVKNAPVKQLQRSPDRRQLRHVAAEISANVATDKKQTMREKLLIAGTCTQSKRSKTAEIRGPRGDASIKESATDKDDTHHAMIDREDSDLDDDVFVA